LEVRRTAKGPQVVLSRTHPGYLVRLFETEIPEIQEGIVVVKAAAREAGERAKVAVASTRRDVDPIGACVGLRGTRIQVISRELRGEKIDIIEWSPDPATFVARALSPAKVSTVTITEPEGPDDLPSALVIVADNQLSLAIGKKGQNARLAAKLTGMRIDIKSESELEAEGPGVRETPAALLGLPGMTPELAEVLVAAGMSSPDAIVRAGVERLREVPDIGSRCEQIYAAAEERVSAKPDSAMAPPESPSP
jgi:N utilization substance protein A